MSSIRRFRFIEFFFFHVFHYYCGNENCSLYRGLRCIEVPLYYETPTLYQNMQFLTTLHSAKVNLLSGHVPNLKWNVFYNTVVVLKFANCSKWLLLPCTEHLVRARWLNSLILGFCVKELFWISTACNLSVQRLCEIWNLFTSCRYLSGPWSNKNLSGYCRGNAHFSSFPARYFRTENLAFLDRSRAIP